MTYRAFKPASLLVLVALTVSPASAGTPPVGAASCSGCHRPDGSGTVPDLGNLTTDEIVAAVAAYRKGERPATVMDRLAKGFTDEEIRAIAAWLTQGPSAKP